MFAPGEPERQNAADPELKRSPSLRRGQGSAGNPKVDAGENKNAANTGWGRSWVAKGSDLPNEVALKTNLVIDANCNWTDGAGTNESCPINCVTWYEALAVCIWDDGRLPTEAEWEFAATGGAENRLYPWGYQPPDRTRANYRDSAHSPKLAVGSFKAGAGAFGHLDLAGSMLEWVFDWLGWTYYGSAQNPASCSNCANTTIDAETDCRVMRGGLWASSAINLRVQIREDSQEPDYRTVNSGFRCARTP